jgi:hypothetical protein
MLRMAERGGRLQRLVAQIRSEKYRKGYISIGSRVIDYVTPHCFVRILGTLRQVIKFADLLSAELYHVKKWNPEFVDPLGELPTEFRKYIETEEHQNPHLDTLKVPLSSNQQWHKHWDSRHCGKWVDHRQDSTEHTDRYSNDQTNWRELSQSDWYDQQQGDWTEQQCREDLIIEQQDLTALKHVRNSAESVAHVETCNTTEISDGCTTELTRRPDAPLQSLVLENHEICCPPTSDKSSQFDLFPVSAGGPFTATVLSFDVQLSIDCSNQTDMVKLTQSVSKSLRTCRPRLTVHRVWSQGLSLLLHVSLKNVDELTELQEYLKTLVFC